MPSTTTILITGANRGIGKGLVAKYLATPNSVVIATVRDPTDATSKSLENIPRETSSSLIVIGLDVSSSNSIHQAIETLKSTHNIHTLDVVIANAGIAGLNSQLTEASVSEIQEYIDINAFGQFELFKAVLPLLKASKSNDKGKFVYISSAGGSLTNMYNIVPLSAYGASKALGNFLFKWLALESESVLIWSQHPGMVATDMAQVGFDGLKEQGIDLTNHIISVETSTEGIKNVIDGATIEKTHGKFLDQNGSELPW
ncbi:hypothetical protein BKA66DRAFT_434337 [Pyrenochaeta sp. MPI-SDFR-AT-0127]|nr:hypothetical protein BKA66DRAFT_434337 [Pyrenochaeta sp. MPI-SDFR-AT-0127]